MLRERGYMAVQLKVGHGYTNGKVGHGYINGMRIMAKLWDRRDLAIEMGRRD
jgi:hypothetical protein